MSRVQQFYARKKVFITGGTGFLGIILTAKLLRSCPEIGTIYLLIREKKGKTIQERIDALLVNPVYDVLRNEYPDFSKKIVGVAGDVGEDGLGLSAADHERIVDEVSVIFHLAATVRFDAKLEVAVAMNVNSVKSIVDIAEACKNLEAGVYVSTAYSHCVRKSINEEMYPPPLSHEEVNKLVNDLGNKKWSEAEISDFTKSVLKDWPNTYSFTKAIAEGVVAEYATELPFAVFRPSIVVSSYTAPIPGWVLSPMGLAGTMCGIGLGLIHTFLVDVDAKIDIVPVDYVCNALISCAWETAVTPRRANEDIPVYNYVSSTENPITWLELMCIWEKFGPLYPSNSAIYYPCGVRSKSRWIFTILNFFLHLLPALMVDSIGQLFGKEPKMYKIARKIENAVHAVGYFTTQQWEFENPRVQNLWKRICPEDKQIFPFSMSNVDWDEHTIKMIRGVRKYILHESEDNLAEARRRRLYLYIVHMIVRLVFFISVAWLTWKLLSGVGLTFNVELFEVSQAN